MLNRSVTVEENTAVKGVGDGWRCLSVSVLRVGVFKRMKHDSGKGKGRVSGFLCCGILFYFARSICLPLFTVFMILGPAATTDCRWLRTQLCLATTGTVNRFNSGNT